MVPFFIFSSVFVPAKRARPLFTWTAVSMTAYAQPLKVRWDRKDEDQTPRLQYTRGWTQQSASRPPPKNKSSQKQKNGNRFAFHSPQHLIIVLPQPHPKEQIPKLEINHAIAIFRRQAHPLADSLHVAAARSWSPLFVRRRASSTTTASHRALVLSGIVRAVQEMLHGW